MFLKKLNYKIKKKPKIKRKSKKVNKKEKKKEKVKNSKIKKQRIEEKDLKANSVEQFQINYSSPLPINEAKIKNSKTKKQWGEEKDLKANGNEQFQINYTSPIPIIETKPLYVNAKKIKLNTKIIEIKKIRPLEENEIIPIEAKPLYVNTKKIKLNTKIIEIKETRPLEENEIILIEVKSLKSTDYEIRNLTMNLPLIQTRPNNTPPHLPKKEFEGKTLGNEDSSGTGNGKIREDEKETVLESSTKDTKDELALEGKPLGNEDSSGTYNEEIKELKKEPILGIPVKNLRDKPVLIYLKDHNDAFTGTLEELLKRFYREIKGGFPIAIKHTNFKTFINELINYRIDEENKILTIDYQHSRELKKENKEQIRNWLEESYTRDLEYIIFKNLDLISDEYLPREHKIEIISLSSNNALLDDFEAKIRICPLLWGFIDISETELKNHFDLNDNINFDDIFNFTLNKYEDYFQSIQVEPFIEITSRSRNNEESEVHYNLKLFTVKFLLESLGLKNKEDLPEMRKFVQVEHELGNEAEIVPDIYIKNNAEKFPNEVFEIETLFGQGILPIKKIDETIKKYEGQPIRRLNIVLENITLINHLHEIEGKLKNHDILKKQNHILKKHNQRNFELEFWGIDIANNRLIAFEEIKKKVEEFKEKGYLPLFPADENYIRP